MFVISGSHKRNEPAGDDRGPLPRIGGNDARRSGSVQGPSDFQSFVGACALQLDAQRARRNAAQTGAERGRRHGQFLFVVFDV